MGRGHKPWLTFTLGGLFLMAGLAASVVSGRTQELYLLGGEVGHADTHDYTTAWEGEYFKGLSDHFAASISYLNEGHLPLHHRDGESLQLWARSHLFERRLSLAVGAGPYYYFDTAKTVSGSFTDDHGFGGLISLTATWTKESRWLLQLRTNYVTTSNNFDTWSALAGIGYQLEAPSALGAQTTTPPQHDKHDKTTQNEITAFLGRSVVNSFDSEHALATSVEYRRGLLPYLDWTAAYLFEGDSRLIRRNGVTTQLWAVREFFADRLALGVGGGAYFAVDHNKNSPINTDHDGFLSAIFSFTASYRFHPHWQARATWNRVVTNYDRDTDIFFGGLGYRF